LADIPFAQTPVLPVGLGRSYGDSGLNDGGALIDIRDLDRFLHFDRERGIVRCEAGLSLADLLDVIVPAGWFVPVSPGTKFVTMAGALANDVHGKNHHSAGTFGCHVRRFELLRSDGTRRECSADENAGLFRATIGGLGLTGLVTWLEFQLKPIPSPWIALEQIRFHSFDEYLALENESSRDFDYTVSWIDCLSGGPGRGLFQRGNFSEQPDRPQRFGLGSLPTVRMPFNAPSAVLNPWVMKLFNALIFGSQRAERVHKAVHYEPFFYPLDMVLDWNRAYGKAGFFQYQFGVPLESVEVFREILARIAESRQGSFLVVLKKTGEIASPGLMSFPRAGLNLALDFPNRGQVTLDLLERLDALVLGAGGSVYPAKDARMSAQSFQSYFPQWKEFERFVDPHFSSSFWRRVTSEENP
jgi:FAD/FMN-containing dehydrogenase